MDNEGAKRLSSIQSPWETCAVHTAILRCARPARIAHTPTATTHAHRLVSMRYHSDFALFLVSLCSGPYLALVGAIQFYLCNLKAMFQLYRAADGAGASPSGSGDRVSGGGVAGTTRGR